VLVCDDREQSARIGELQHAPANTSRAVELGAVASGTVPGRTSPEQLTVCDLSGIGVQDVAAAALVLRRAGEPSARLVR
jgi:ornithine cyclodeaminase